MAEIDLTVLARQYLDHRIPDLATLTPGVAAWQERRNQAATTIRWRFTTADARIKRHSPYPTVQP